MQGEVKSGYLRDPAEQLTNQKLTRTGAVQVGRTAELEVHCVESYGAMWPSQLSDVGQDTA
jgi:hypothetical protein